MSNVHYCNNVQNGVKKQLKYISNIVCFCPSRKYLKKNCEISKFVAHHDNACMFIMKSQKRQMYRLLLIFNAAKLGLCLGLSCEGHEGAIKHRFSYFEF